MDDTVKSATQKLEFALLKKIKEVSDQLQVEDLIGTSATYYDFKDYARGIFDKIETLQTKMQQNVSEN